MDYVFATAAAVETLAATKAYPTKLHSLLLILLVSIISAGSVLQQVV